MLLQNNKDLQNNLNENLQDNNNEANHWYGLIESRYKSEVQKRSMREINLNLMKLMFIYFDDHKMIPEMLTFSYYEADKIKSRFAVIYDELNTLFEFETLQGAIRFTEMLAEQECFYTHEFYDKFRIVEISGSEDELEILAIIVNLVDYFDVICAIQDGKFNKNMFNDEEFNEYYEEFISIL